MLTPLAGEFAWMRRCVWWHAGVGDGKTDIRDPGVIAQQQFGVRHRAFDLFAEAGLDRIAQDPAELATLFGDGALRPLPVTTDVRCVPRRCVI